MARIEKTVFISYRHTNAFGALAIFQNLKQHDYDTFLDYTGIASGDFAKVILQNIRSRAHFVVLLTPSALERTDEPGDWLRREIETALDSKRNIIPLMLEGFDFSTPSIAKYLTGNLALLKQYNGLPVPAHYFDAAMKELRDKFLNVPLDAVLHPASPEAERAASQEESAAAAAPQVTEEALTAQQWFERGFDAKDLYEMIQLYTKAIRLKPDFPVAFNNRGNARVGLGDFEGALADYNEAISLKPDYAEAFYNRGKYRHHKGDLDGAIADYSEAIRLKSDLAEAFNNRGDLRTQRGDIEGALSDCNEALRLKPDFFAAFNNRGNARQEQGDHSGALKDYDQAIRLKPGHASAFYNRARARNAQGDLDGALRDYDHAIRLKPEYADAYSNRSKLRAVQGDLDGALSDLNEVIPLEPTDARNFFDRAVVRRAKSDKSGALADLDEAIRLKPDFAEAIELRKSVSLRSTLDRLRQLGILKNFGP
jgi:tetratricopeptide (TPR) repeat protein